jgi:hypothetical protein
MAHGPNETPHAPIPSMQVMEPESGLSTLPQLESGHPHAQGYQYVPDHSPHWGHPRFEPRKDRLPDSEWIHKLCVEPSNDAATCCEGYWVPCVLYGKTQYRLDEMATGKDPLDETDYKGCNGPCWIFCAASTLNLSCV